MSISTIDHIKILYLAQGLDQKTHMVLSRVFSFCKFCITLNMTRLFTTYSIYDKYKNIEKQINKYYTMCQENIQH